MLDVAEAVLVDAAAHGADINRAGDQVGEWLDELFPNRATWGTLPHHREAAAVAESMFGPSRPS